MNLNSIPLLILTLFLIYVSRKLVGFWRAVRAIQNHPGRRTLFSNFSMLGSVLPKMRGVTLGRAHMFDDKHDPFASAGWDVYSSITIFPNTRTNIILADAAAIKEVTSSRFRFPKPVHQYQALSFYGHNIVASEGEEWKKYRKISAPAFSDRNNKLVWDETVKIIQGLFTDVWKDGDVVHVDHCLDITLPIALFVIGAAGFGRTIRWEDDDVIPPGHQMTFKAALTVVTTEIVVKIFVPAWALGLTARFRKVRLAFAELHSYMSEMIRARENTEKVERHDLFSSLLAANDHSEDSNTLSENEIIANIYMFLVAGHETAAHTLSFTFALLALYPDEQEKLVEHIRSVIPKGRDATYEEMPLLTYALAVFYETLRLFPQFGATGIPKVAAEDTSIVASNSAGEQITVPIPKGTAVTVSTPGTHYNPRYWEDPHSFKPARFLGDWPREAFVSFSAGARACIGRKFFETEGIATLTMVVSHYKITIKEEPRFAGETFEQRRARVLATCISLTLKPVRVPLTFTRRT